MRGCWSSFAISLISFACISTSYAANPINLNFDKTNSILRNEFVETSKSVDFNHTTHVRVQQTFQGVPIFGGDAIIHIPANVGFKNLKSIAATNHAITSSGTTYTNLQKDLGNKPSSLLKMPNFKSVLPKSAESESVEPIIFVDNAKVAHWAFKIAYTAPDRADGVPSKPVRIVDASSLKTYIEWDRIQTAEKADGGGFGGNVKAGQFVYDGLTGNLPKLNIERGESGTCYLRNSKVTVLNYNSKNVVSFDCTTPDAEHNNVYWSGKFDEVNGAYSPSNDALYVGEIINNLYQDWYHIPALVDENGNARMLNMVVHRDMENAYWDGKVMTFGDGGSVLYPLVSLGVGAHEVSHGFTQMHSNLFYFFESGGLNESFSDMAAQAAEYYTTGKNTWQIGPEIFKGDRALRYMDQPSKDCNGKSPGDKCSIDSYTQYNPFLDVHFSSGVYNRAFYTLATSPNWNTQKAFNVMVHANMHYWTMLSGFYDAGCGVVKSARDYKYDVETVRTALFKVGVITLGC